MRDATVGGRIVDTYGNANAGTVHLVSPKRRVDRDVVAQLYANPRHLAEHVKSGSASSQTAVTTDGSFRFENVPFGQYVICAEGTNGWHSTPGLMELQVPEVAVQLTLKNRPEESTKPAAAHISTSKTEANTKASTKPTTAAGRKKAASEKEALVPKWAIEIKGIVAGGKVNVLTAGKPVPIDDGLYLGDARAARDVKNLQKLGITAVVNCSSGTYTRTSAKTYGEQCIYLELTGQVIGDERLSPPQMQVALDFIKSAIRDERKVLVHCISGTNRSASVCIAHVMLSRQWQVLKAVYHVFQARNHILTQAVFHEQIAELALSHGLAEPRKAGSKESQGLSQGQATHASSAGQAAQNPMSKPAWHARNASNTSEGQSGRSATESVPSVSEPVLSVPSETFKASKPVVPSLNLRLAHAESKVEQNLPVATSEETSSTLGMHASDGSQTAHNPMSKPAWHARQAALTARDAPAHAQTARTAPLTARTTAARTNRTVTSGTPRGGAAHLEGALHSLKSKKGAATARAQIGIGLGSLQNRHARYVRSRSRYK